MKQPFLTVYPGDPKVKATSKINMMIFGGEKSLEADHIQIAPLFDWQHSDTRWK